MSKGRVRGLRIRTFVVTAALAAFGLACVQGEGADRGDPVARLESLGAAWLRTPATVTYRTVEHEAGDAESVHQCLRQMFEYVVETAIRMCNGEGELRLIWDPPDRWRMEVSNARGSSVLTSSPDGAYRCHRTETGRRRCAPTSAGDLVSDTPFAALFLRPSQILGELGPGAADSVTTLIERDIAGSNAECFSAALAGRNGDRRRAEWCYSKDGVLLSSLVELAEVGTTMLEAIDVSSDVSDADLAIDVDR